MTKARYEDGYFVPAVPIPDDRPISSYRWYHVLGTLRALLYNPLETFNAVHYKIPVSQYPLLGRWFTVVNHPEFIRHCFVERRDNYIMHGVRQRILRPMLGDGLITATGEQWSSARRLMSPMFTPRNIRHFGDVMRIAAERETERLFAPGDAEIAGKLNQLTYMVLSDTLFSGDIEEDTAEVIENVAAALNYMGRPDPMDMMNAPSWVPRLATMPGRGAVKRLRRMIDRVLKKRQAEIENGQMPADDFMTRLILAGEGDNPAFTAQDIEDHMISFVAAGHETTSRALSWMFYLLSQHPETRERVEAEIDALDANQPPETWDTQLPFTLACFEETMRLFPPAPFITRQSIDDDQFATTYVPSDSVLFVNLWQLHRHETLWEHPERFDPMRFFGEARDKIDRFQYLPFGVGERVCIGARFAQQEALILIATLLRKFRFDYASDTPPRPIMRITVRPDNDMPMQIKLRK